MSFFQLMDTAFDFFLFQFYRGDGFCGIGLLFCLQINKILQPKCIKNGKMFLLYLKQDMKKSNLLTENSVPEHFCLELILAYKESRTFLYGNLPCKCIHYHLMKQNKAIFYIKRTYTYMYTHT